ncbi:MAG: NRDE family protein [Pyrinomonadaceae bacterium]
MCTILIAYGMLADHPLVVLANRDEYYERPTLSAGYWEDHPEIYAGRDLIGGGTWMGVTTGGRFAAVTNYREPAAAGMRSRGELVAEFLKSNVDCNQFLRSIEGRADEYSPFNLLVGDLSPDRRSLQYFSNRSSDPVVLSSGIYGLSNHLLDTPWPKVANGKEHLTAMIVDGGLDRTRSFEILADETQADDSNLPSTGISYDAEKALSAIFIKTPGYGTRCSTVLSFDNDGSWEFEEKVFV